MVVERLKINGRAMTTKELKILECECDFLVKLLKRVGMSQPRPSVSSVANAKEMAASNRWHKNGKIEKTTTKAGLALDFEFLSLFSSGRKSKTLTAGKGRMCRKVKRVGSGQSDTRFLAGGLGCDPAPQRPGQEENKWSEWCDCWP